MSGSTFPLHQFLLYAASASPGLPGLAAARDLLTCPFVAELCACMCVCIRVRVCICSQVKQFPTHLQAPLCLACLNKWF